ncbi:ADAMTS-like protein 5 [Phasianus colchicus]|uniref:ADAMTS-like protein 5 n=1 Tax=Phasianus colchicus TaxID=9054 RepID=UPI00129EFC44|nr:ADAMTS-like protein 5 [Phasianus colchicus]
MQVPAPGGARWDSEPPTHTRPRRQPAQGAWGPWGPWSVCSSSCGDGVAFRTRRCLRSAEEEPCTGDQRQYRLCQLQGCPGSSVPFRAMQCSLYDDKPVRGMQTRHRWVPFYGAPNVCDLNCLAVGHNFYYTFGRVLDGTRCRPGSTDLCVGGRCLSVGCDGILGMGAQTRACSRCGGGQDGCLFVHRLFQDTEPFSGGYPLRPHSALTPCPPSGHFGYMNVTKIPAGATNIKVTDKSRNFLGRTCSVPVPVHPIPSYGHGQLCSTTPPHSECNTPHLRALPEVVAVSFGQCRATTGPGGLGSSALGIQLCHGTWSKSAMDLTLPHTPHTVLPSMGARCPLPAQPGVPDLGHAWLSPDVLLPTALMGSDGRYVLNGDWSIAWPGPYEAAGTQLLYARSPDGTESLEAPGPTDEDLHVLVLLQEPNPGIEYEFWLPRGHPQHSTVDTSALRQPQPRGAGSPPPAEPPLPTLPPRAWDPITEPLPPRSPPGVRAAAGDLPHPPTPLGSAGGGQGRGGNTWRDAPLSAPHSHPAVFRARILARRSVGQEMRYEVQVVTPYRHRFPMVPREYVWVPDTCGCPTLLGGHEYVLMARRHVNYEHTLNRILLQRDGYARPWSPREERAVRDAERHCAHLQ